MSRAANNRDELARDTVYALDQDPVGHAAMKELARVTVQAWLEQLAQRVLANGMPIVLPGFGTFYRATWTPKVGRFAGEKRHRLAFRPATRNRAVVP